MNSLGFRKEREIADAIRVAGGVKDGYMLWEEFLDFFFLRG